jgi:hypothetical protein
MYAKLLQVLIAVAEAAIVAIASDLAIKAAKKVTEKMEN